MPAPAADFTALEGEMTERRYRPHVHMSSSAIATEPAISTIEHSRMSVFGITAFRDAKRGPVEDFRPSSVRRREAVRRSFAAGQWNRWARILRSGAAPPY